MRWEDSELNGIPFGFGTIFIIYVIIYSYNKGLIYTIRTTTKIHLNFVFYIKQSVNKRGWAQGYGDEPEWQR